ncbi:hypothetical protein A6456_10490 [Paraburkholderia tropica]|nr:hypothetical protein A6456_10490 [Paraburkholderia tropica]
MLFVAFSDNTQTTIIAIFSCAQDEEYWPNQGQIELSDSRYKTYFELQPVFMQQYLPTPVTS